MSEQSVNSAKNMRKSLNIDEALSIDANDIIDVAAFDFSDDEKWLYVPNQCIQEPIKDLHAWLRTEPEIEPSETESYKGMKKLIDTRTFTRPKKRISRLSFESVAEALSPPPVSNVWKIGGPLSGIELQPNNEENIASSTVLNARDSVPAMLRPPSVAFSNFVPNNSVITGQESMEAFLNMSQSKGIDSFINLTEPEFSDTLMNVSQVSELNSSIASLHRDDSSRASNQDNLDDPQILTDSMMQTSMFGDVMDIKNFEETFSTDNADKTFIENRSYNVSPVDKTFVNKSQNERKISLNRTFDTLVRETQISLARYSLPMDIEKEKMNVTFTSSPQIDKPALDETLVNSHNETSEVLNNLDETYKTYRTCKLKQEKMNTTINDDDDDIVKRKHDAELSAAFAVEKNKPSQDEISPTHEKVLNSTFDGPTSLRKELLDEVRRSARKNLDTTYNHIVEDSDTPKDTEQKLDATYNPVSGDYKDDAPIVNRYNTYRKDTAKILSRNSSKFVEPNEHSNHMGDRKFYTFTKRLNNVEAKGDAASKEALESLDATFSKPAPKPQRKLRGPRVLSKLPQSLQKSNPNLVSNSLKTMNVMGYTNVPNLRYAKGSQPNISRNIEGSLANRLYSLERFKSGSEQRLLDVTRNAREHQGKGASGSTESIESTQSAHSAPDLDDRLSVCSDSSHNSYNVRAMNIEQLHKIVRMQEESLKQASTPKPSRRVLENTWVDREKDLPSPILKNGTEYSGSSCSSLRSVDSAVKTSSPLLSPDGSSQSINVAGLRDQNAAARKSEVDTKTLKNIGTENKTRLRQPTNWNTMNKPFNAASGIPRPASRIPAPRFARPSTKSSQGDWKKGCL